MAEVSLMEPGHISLLHSRPLPSACSNPRELETGKKNKINENPGIPSLLLLGIEAQCTISSLAGTSQEHGLYVYVYFPLM